MKGMILAAGLGTRLKPFTDKHPKALVPVKGKSLLLRNIEYLASYGVKDLIVNVHHFAEQIIEHLALHALPGVRVCISDESDAVLETGGGLKKAAWFFDDGRPFVLMNVDILTRLPLDQLIRFHQQHRALATLAVSDRQSSRCFLFNNQHQLCGWRNRQNGEERICRDEDDWVEKSFSGIQVIDPAFLTQLTQEGKFSIVDTYLKVAEEHAILGYDHSGIEVLDVGKPESIQLAEERFG